MEWRKDHDGGARYFQTYRFLTPLAWYFLVPVLRTSQHLLVSVPPSHICSVSESNPPTLSRPAQSAHIATISCPVAPKCLGSDRRSRPFSRLLLATLHHHPRMMLLTWTTNCAAPPNVRTTPLRSWVRKESDTRKVLSQTSPGKMEIMAVHPDFAGAGREKTRFSIVYGSCKPLNDGSDVHR